MRIISGTARGTKLYTLDGIDTRPTLDRVKEPLFSIIMNYINNAKVLDLFAGSAALGLEALSRGAKEAVFGEVSKQAVEIINKNIEKTHFQNKSRVINKDYSTVLKILSNNNEVFDIIFLDPPYKSNFDLIAIKSIIKMNLLAEDGIIIVETDDEDKIKQINNIENIVVQNVKKYGRVKLVFLQILKGVK